MKQVSFVVDGVNACKDLHPYPEYDCYCPMIGTKNAHGFNCYQSSCDTKQQNRELYRTCYPQCHYHGDKLSTQIKLAPKRSKPRINFTIQLARAMLVTEEEGKLTRKEIAAMYEVSTSTVCKYIKTAIREREVLC